MKMWIALLILAAPAAFGQNTLTTPFAPEGFRAPQTLPRTFMLQPLTKPIPMVIVPNAWFPRAGAEIDPQIVRHPMPGAFAQQQPRVPIAQNLYPGLKLLPTETARMEPIPITWPGFKLEPIPTTWPNVRAVPVKAAANAATTEK